MKKILSFLLFTVLCFDMSIELCISSFCVPGESTPYSWYCKHVTDERKPVLDAQMSFITSFEGYYLDPNADVNNKTVYLTFDAGYENGNVEKVLDILKEKNVRGSFFILKNLADRNPDLVKRMDSEGHLVCNHTATHKDVSAFVKKDELEAELKCLEDTVYEKTGVHISKYFRPPEGKFSKQDLTWAMELGYKTVFWSFAYADWDNNNQMRPCDAFKKITDGIHPGEILLLHPTSETNCLILSDVIDVFIQKGYEFKTLDELTYEAETD